MKAILNINYFSNGDPVCIITQSGSRMVMTSVDNASWSCQVDIEAKFEYKYVVGQRVEFGPWRSLDCVGEVGFVYDSWRDEPANKQLYSSFYKDFVYMHDKQALSGTVVLKVTCPWVKRGDVMAIVGSGERLGAWDAKFARKMSYVDDATWAIGLENGAIKPGDRYKFVIISDSGQVQFEEGDNRLFHYDITTLDGLQISDLKFNAPAPASRLAGVAIPVFSLRSENSVGIGDFADLSEFAKWTAKIGGKVVQILPINDTTITHTWVDSYPYKAISIYALHPLYLSLEKMGVLKNAELAHRIADEQQRLNALSEVDYEAVECIKSLFFREIYAQEGQATLQSEAFKKFFETNSYWVAPYALFSHLRDVNDSADFSTWGQWSVYNEEMAKRMISDESADRNKIMFYAFLQYHLDKQLKEVRQIAQSFGVALKGDIPIGISRHSVEAWVEPHLFNMNSQAGAPPDDFSISGQNWGFPTYNWDEMAKDGYSWWKRRFRKMADYFDLYRIDHILGFFRIWQIPFDSVEGLLGQFNPALPFSHAELEGWGLPMDENRFLKPFIHWDFLENYMGKSFNRYKEFLSPLGNGFFELKPEFDTQVKIQAALGDEDEQLKQSLFRMVNEVLFVRDSVDGNLFHPRIAAHSTMSYQWLSDYQKWRFNELYTNFFYHRQNQFWGEKAMAKLPSLIDSTNMLCCAEDLGMIPGCVADVLGRLQVITLEIERMPKDSKRLFGDTHAYPYLSVCTTSTHDMSPIRLFWMEGLESGVTQKYYNEVMGWYGGAPAQASGEICKNIVRRHFESPSILSIIPLQDLLAIDESLRRENAEEERINVPSNPNHYWRYRMHVNIEELERCDEFTETIQSMIYETGRACFVE